MKKSVPEQKGPIDANPMTSKQMTHEQKLQERSKELKDLKSGQTMTYHSPQKKK